MNFEGIKNFVLTNEEKVHFFFENSSPWVSCCKLLPPSLKVFLWGNISKIQNIFIVLKFCAPWHKFVWKIMMLDQQDTRSHQFQMETNSVNAAQAVQPDISYVN